MAGSAAAIITESSAEMNAVRVKSENEAQNLPDLPDQRLFFLCVVRSLGAGDEGSSGFSSSLAGGLGTPRVDMMNS